MDDYVGCIQIGRLGWLTMVVVLNYRYGEKQQRDIEL